MHNLVIYGAGGLGREVAVTVKQLSHQYRFWNFLGFIDDGEPKDSLDGSKLLGGMDFIRNYNGPLEVVIAIANSKIKSHLYKELKAMPHVSFPNVIAPDVFLSDNVTMGEGVIISAKSFISVDVYLGNCVFLNTRTQIGHDSKIGDFCSVMSSTDISGHVTIGTGCLIGVGSSILQGMNIGENSTVGMGAVVMASVPDNCTVIGNPAREWRVKTSHES